jgi:protein phosphatase
MQVVAGGCSNPGQLRSINEDRYAVRTRRATGDWDAVLMVADGMGGYLAGEVASGMAVEQMLDVCDAESAAGQDPESTLRRAIVEANDAIRRAAASDPGLRGMGTTVAAALVRDGQLHIGHVGDSRVYLVRGASIFQLTEDHSWVAREVRAGRLNAEDAEHHPERHVLTQAVGGNARLHTETATYSLYHGDIVLLCTDGLSTLVNGPEFVEITRGYRQPDVAAEKLVAIANTRGAPDNVTAVVARVEDGASDTRTTRELVPPRAWTSHKMHPRVSIVALALLLVGVVVVAALVSSPASGLIAEFGR